MKRYWSASWIVTMTLLPAVLLAQDRGSIGGQVIDETSLRPLVGVQVAVGGTTLGSITNQQGRYLILNVPTGQREVRASVIGYGRGSLAVNVIAGEAATANFALTPSVLEIEGVIATATGQELRRREIGNTVTNIVPGNLELAPVTSFAQLLQGRVPGATIMQSSGTVGAGSRIRIRGNNSVSLSNAPLLIVDGIRVQNSERSVAYGVGGQEPSRFDDLNPENIESIEILKGPAAAALYGTAAANGVIQVTTKRGYAGAPRFRAWSEFGTMEERTAFPDNRHVSGTLVGGPGIFVPPGTVGRCDNIRRAIGATPGPGEVGCTGTVESCSFNPLENPETTPWETGQLRSVGVSVSGGGDQATFYISGGLDSEGGVLRQNDLRRIVTQANFSGQVGRNLRVGTNIGWVESDLELPQNDNALFGILNMGLSGDPRPQFVEANQGYIADPRFFYDWITTQALSRFTGAANADYRPLDWLRLNAIVGLDRSARSDINRLPQSTVFSIYGPPFEGGFIQNSSISVYHFNAGATGTAVFNFTPDVTSTSSLGTSYLREEFEEVYAFGSRLTPGIEESLAGATAFFAADEGNLLNATASAYLREQVAWRDRVFVTGSIRGDRNTAFGTSIGWVWYPSVSTSWVISEEEFFPAPDWLGNLRLRAAWGRSGLRPGATDALQSFVSRVNVFQASEEPAVIINAVGNPTLKPETATEWEFGFETGLLNERIGAEITYFSKTSRDALISRPLPPSLGSSGSRLENLGRVENRGIEGLLNLRPLSEGDIQWDLTLSGSLLSNNLADLGTDLQGKDIEPIQFGLLFDTQRHQEGFPLGSWFHRPITFNDANGDGRLVPSEVTVADTAQFLGNPFPTRETSLATSVNAFGWIRLSGLLDYKGGHEIMNFTRAFRCADYVCADVYDDNVPLETQAAIIGANVYGTMGGWVESADFWRLREVALTLNLPQRFANRLSSDVLSITFAGRNLATWTGYSGFDPEVNFAGQANFSSGDAATLPPTRQLMVRIDANF